jgi:stage V sporulation protein AE
MGLFSGGFKAGAVGCAAALIFGYLAGIVFKSRMKK